MRSHPTRSFPLLARATPSTCDSISSLYTSPSSTDTLPVYEPVTLSWNPACVDVGTEMVDLYLNVVEESVGSVAVHEWTGVSYEKGSLETVLKPGWWNASTGQGEVQAQLGIVPAGQPIWNTPAPSGPLFTISYNGSYPSVTNSAPEPIYTGPSVESVADQNANSSKGPISGGKLGAAVGVPLLVVAIAVIAYVGWNRMRKRPEKKRFSAVVDKRMSMMSQGTWQPRPSMAQSSRHRPSGSMYSTGNRHSYFADPNHQRNSTYSAVGLGSSPLRPPQPAEMRKREIGEGDRISRVSFAGTGGERPSFSSSRAGTGGGRKSLHQSQLSRTSNSNSPPSQHSQQHSSPLLTTSQSSSSLLSQSSRFEDPISRSGTTEELLDSQSINNNLRLFNSHSHKPSTSSSLRNPLNPSSTSDQDQDEDPFLTPPTPLTSSQTLNRPKLSPLSTTSFEGMRQLSPIGGGGGGGQEESVLSPDQALASYSVARALSPAPPGLALGGGGGKLGSMKNLLKRFKSSQSLRNDVREKENEEKEEGGGERAKSPFGDEFGEEQGGQGHVIPEIRRDQGGGFEGLGYRWNDGEKGEEEEMKEKEEKGWNGGNAY